MLRELWYDESGLTTVEYALVLAIIVLACFTVSTLISLKVRSSSGEATQHFRD